MAASPNRANFSFDIQFGAPGAPRGNDLFESIP